MTELCLAGRWPLGDVLADCARRRGVRLRTGEPAAQPCLRIAGGVPIALPDGAALVDAVLAAALASVGRCLTPSPAAVLGTVLRPAAGLCGPAPHGPVDAVRTGYVTRLEAHPLAFRAACRLVDVQHTRCWVASLTFTGTCPLAFTPGVEVAVLPSVIARDTARTSQYMIDCGEGFHWRSVALAGPPVSDVDGSATTLAMFTDAHYVNALLDACLRRAAPRPDQPEQTAMEVRA
jgi:hypothetical protein